MHARVYREREGERERERERGAKRQAISGSKSQYSTDKKRGKISYHEVPTLLIHQRTYLNMHKYS
jgi:hypothetical protein